MSWMLTVVRSSIGKKIIMAVSGACLSLFLLAHLAGNAVSFWGKEAYNAYASHLHSLSFLIHVFESCLVLVFLIHILTATILFVEDLSARPSRYVVPGDGRSCFARSMPYTGGLILLFLAVHLANFHFADKAVSTAELVRTTLSNPVIALFYVVALCGLTLHVGHGFWSLLQSLGLNHPKYNSVLQGGGLSLAVFIGAIFMLIPLLILTTDRFLQ